MSVCNIGWKVDSRRALCCQVFATRGLANERSRLRVIAVVYLPWIRGNNPQSKLATLPSNLETALRRAVLIYHIDFHVVAIPSAPCSVVGRRQCSASGKAPTTACTRDSLLFGTYETILWHQHIFIALKSWGSPPFPSPPPRAAVPSPRWCIELCFAR